MLGTTYKSYINALAHIGTWGKRHNETPPSIGHAPRPQEGDEKPGFDHDSAATTLGNRYRGMGVAIGLLGAAIVLCAVLPVALNLHHGPALAVGIAKVALMTLMVGIIYYGIRSKTRDKWVMNRRHAERQRYKSLSGELQKEEFDANKVRELLAPILREQVRYNHAKMEQYESIETFSDRLSWLAFGLAFAAAVIHLFHHADWLLFFTAFGPALVGAVHGINGFLRIGDLAEDHDKMYHRLQELAEALDAVANDVREEVREIATAAYELLCDRDARWEEHAHRLGLKVA